MRWWAFWRRVQYICIMLIFFSLVGTGVYFSYVYEEPTCFDSTMNGDERGIDCGGLCTRICSIDVIAPTVVWSESFRVVPGVYNAVSYIENKNITAGSPEVGYVFKLFDEAGLITERRGSTLIPPDSVYPIFEGRIETGDRIPTRTEIELDDITLWLPAISGREQFVTESRGLTGADSNPRLDAVISNRALTEARDVEVVATIFDVNGNALNASRTIVPNFRERSEERIVFTWPEPISKTLRSCSVPTDVVLAIDVSGSMNDDGGNPPEPISSVLTAAEDFTVRLGKNDSVGLVTYATEAFVKHTLTREKDSVASAIRSLSISPKDEVGSTNTGDGIRLGAEELNSSRHNADARKVLVLLTDGLANAPDEDPEAYALKEAEILKESGADVYVIGLGDSLNEEFLKEIATANSNYFKAVSITTLNTIYSSITDAICEDGPAVIEIIPKTEASFAPLR